MRWVKIDLHVHTTVSMDSWISPEKLPEIAKRNGMDGIAVTDHNTTAAWQAVKRAAEKVGVAVIEGEEVRVKPAGRTVGEIIGLYMTDFVDGTGKTALEVIDALKAQDAVVVLPHPFDKYRKIFPEEELRELSVKVDAVEVFNPRIFAKGLNEKARAFALEYGLAETAGSDAHVPWEVGKAYTEAPAADVEGFRKALLAHKTRAYGTCHPFITRILPSLAKLKNRILSMRPKQG